MSRFLSFLNLRKRILCILALLLTALLILLQRSGFPQTESQKFTAFSESVFRSELSGSTLNLHYTVADPKSYGLEEHPVSLGNASLASRTRGLTACENYLSALEGFDREKLSDSLQLTFDIFQSYLTTELSAAPLLLYDEPLGPTLGIQAQLPVLFAEYPFRTKGDIEDYLALLTQVPDYFSSILSFEQDKANAGLFMSDTNAKEVIRQCRDFVRAPQQNFLLSIFDEKIDAVANLTADEKISYKKQNRSAVTAHVLPAYERLADGLTALLGSGQNEYGLYYLPQGVAYYKYLIQSRVGDSRSIAQIEERIKQQMVEDFAEIRHLLTKRGAMQQSEGGTAQQSEGGTARQSEGGTARQSVSGQSADAAPAVADPVQILQDLRRKIKQDFPEPPSVSCEVKYVPAALQPYLSPAFYLTPAIDSYKENVIYINPASSCSGVDLYTTLAHEGYPGHLYQSVCFQAQSPDLLRCILDITGYAEGWATYVEMYASALWPGDPDEAALAQKNRSFTLGLASLLDLGVHCHGYTQKDVAVFLEKLGFSSDTAASLYRSILQAPANYLNYYVGFLNFLDLREEAKKELGEQFSLRKFHAAVLKTGPAPFTILRKQVLLELGASSEAQTLR